MFRLTSFASFKKRLIELFLCSMMVLSVMAPLAIAQVTDATVYAVGENFVLENDLIRFNVTPNLMVDQVLIKSPWTGVMFSYFYMQWRTDAGELREFAFGDVADGTLTSGVEATGVYVTYNNMLTDVDSVVHNITVKISLPHNSQVAQIDFQDISSERINLACVFADAIVYPQGWENQLSGGKVNVGGNTTYTDPLTYENNPYYFTSAGTILQDTDIVDENQIIDNYIVCYSDAVSVGFFGHYVDLRNFAVNSWYFTEGEETFGRQQISPFYALRSIHDYHHEVTFYFGIWANGSASSIQDAYVDLPLVESLQEQTQIDVHMVQADLNAHLYEYLEGFEEIAYNLKQPNLVTGESGNSILMAAGNLHWKFFKHQGYPETWNKVTRDTGEDYVQKAIDLARAEDLQVWIELDDLDPVWNVQNPDDAAISIDEVTPQMVDCPELHSQQYDDPPEGVPDWYVTDDLGETWHACPNCGGTGQVKYWVKLMELVTPGRAYHDAFIEYVTYLCENYNFYAIALSECFYRDVDYSAQAKAQFMLDTGLDDWPRHANGTIDVYDTVLGDWKTSKLCLLFDEIRDIAHANDKKFVKMVQANFANEENMAREYGHYWPEVIQHTDGLWVWCYYGSFNLDPREAVEVVANQLNILQEHYPEKENILSIGLWDINTNETTPISPELFKEGLDWVKYYWDGGVEVTPSKWMSEPYWDALWGEMPVVIPTAPPYGNIPVEPSPEPTTKLPLGYLSLGDGVNLGSAYMGDSFPVSLNVTFGGNSIQIKEVLFSSPFNSWLSTQQSFPVSLTLGSGQLNYVLHVPEFANAGVYEGTIIVKGIDPFYNSVSALAPVRFTVLGESEASLESEINPWIYLALGVVLVFIIAASIVYRRRF